MTSPDREKRSGLNDEVLAGEYVLGALSEAANAELAKRVKTDRQFAATVRRWQDNLSQTQHNDRRAFSAYRIHSAGENGRRINRRRPSLVIGIIASLWGSVRFWRFMAVAALLWLSVLLV